MIKCCILIERRVAIQKGMYEMDGWMDEWMDEWMNTPKKNLFQFKQSKHFHQRNQFT
jgi:hypothetical protein